MTSMSFMYKRKGQSSLPVTENNGGTNTGPEKSGEAEEYVGNVPFKQRIRHFTFAWFASTMATGGISTLLANQPNTFDGIRTIGKVVFIFDIAMFLLFAAAILARFIMFPGTLSKAIRHPTEALFIPTFFLSMVNIFDGIQAYGVPSVGPWLPYVERVLFWTYLACTFLLAVGQYLYLFTAPPQRLTVQSMTPAWILPIFPVMLSGTFASTILPTQPDVQRMAIIAGGVTMQGLGWMVAFLMFGAYIQRLIQYGLPAPNLRPGMFIAVGPPSFTGLALIGMGRSIPNGFEYFSTHPTAYETLQQLALFSAIFLWALALWFFSISLCAVLLTVREMSFHLVWYALVFPNVGFTIVVIEIGRGLYSEGIKWVGSVMTILLICTWLFVMGMHARAVITKKMMMPGMDEDKDQYKDDDRKHNIPTPP